MTRTGQTLAEYLTVSEAAEYLGVSPWTLRNWDKAGRLRPLRHPKNGYRIYRQEDLAKILELEGVGPGALERLSPQADWRGMNPGEHFVQFYEADEFLVDAVAGFIGSALVVQEGALIVPTRKHREAIEAELKRRGLDLEAARQRGQYAALDAVETLGKFMVNGMPDADLMLRAVGDVITRMKRGRRRVRAFGEMVTVLWQEGNREAAVRLEEIWNELNQDQSFTLFCAYPVDGVGSEQDAELFNRVCMCHTHVVPAEGYASLETPQERLREVTRLQHRVAALEEEVGRLRRESDEAGKGESIMSQSSSQKAGLNGRGLRILLVDDHVDTLNALERLLKMGGHQVTTAVSVQAASGASSANPSTPIDLLVSDIGLPDGSGLDVLRHVRSAHPAVKAVAMTGYGMEQDIAACEQAGFNAHLTKPVDVTKLLETIRQLTN